MSEHDLQVAVFEWVYWQKRKMPELGNLFAIPNGGKRHPAIAAKMKAEGVMRGVPDCFLAVPTETSHGLFLEHKWGKGGMSEHQLVWRDKLMCWGYDVQVSRSFEESKNILLAHIERAL